MKAVQVLGGPDAPKITVNEAIPKPEPIDVQILVKVLGAGITGDEVTWPELYENSTAIPGFEIAGTIEGLGPNYAESLSVGDEVWALVKRGQGQAEYAICQPNEVSRKPAVLSCAEAAALPIPVLTAWQAVFEKAKLRRGMKVLVTGASGSVGRILVQMARQLLYAEVTALATSRHHTTLRQLGAKQVLNYRVAGWETSANWFDCVFDTVGGDVLSKTWDMVKPNGTIVTVGPPQPWVSQRSKPDELRTHPNVKCEYFIVSPDAEALAEIAELIDRGSLKAMAIKEFPIHQAPEAWSFGQRRDRDAKSVLTFNSGE